MCDTCTDICPVHATAKTWVEGWAVARQWGGGCPYIYAEKLAWRIALRCKTGGGFVCCVHRHALKRHVQTKAISPSMARYNGWPVRRNHSTGRDADTPQNLVGSGTVCLLSAINSPKGTNASTFKTYSEWVFFFDKP